MFPSVPRHSIGKMTSVFVGRLCCFTSKFIVGYVRVINKCPAYVYSRLYPLWRPLTLPSCSNFLRYADFATILFFKHAVFRFSVDGSDSTMCMLWICLSNAKLHLIFLSDPSPSNQSHLFVAARETKSCAQ